MPQWTEEQERAIYTSGSDTLVAAAAGSGKTAVLVERIIQKVLNQEDPIDIDALLVATFTNASAQEMRNRVAAALERALQESPESNHLKKQLALLQQAAISTLHSFCMDLIRRHAYLLDIDPGFHIANEIEADMLRQEVLEDLFESWYGKEFVDQEAFFAVVDRFSTDRSDRDVETLVLKLYNFAVQNPWPEQWLDQIVDNYQVDPSMTEEDISWLAILKNDVSMQLAAMEVELSQALQFTKESDGPYHYAEALDNDFHLLQEAKSQLVFGWDAVQETFVNTKFKALSRKKMDCDEDKKEKVKAIRNKVKKRWSSLAENLFSRKLSSYLADIEALQPTLKQLVLLVKEFKQNYSRLKKEKALVDFGDLEHYALAILLAEESTPDQAIPSAVAEGLREKYAEVLVDEYQDTNMVQETILSLVTRDAPGNLFMVGDVKQSIYRFRHAEPSLFIEKYKRFIQHEVPAVRIDLARNFRSRKEVLSAANFIFRQLFDETVGEIDYDSDAELIYANFGYDEVEKKDPEAELVIIDRSEQEEQMDEDDVFETPADLAKAQIEARAYAKRIKQWIGNEADQPTQILDKETGANRPVQYRDIVILLRSMTWAPTIMEELKQQGIPVYAELASGYLEAIEIKIMISLLKVIDNPQQDIPLASVLRSPIVGLNEEDLAQIRLANRHVSYYQALQTFAIETNDQKKRSQVDRFLQQLTDWRTKTRQGALATLIWQIYRETGYYDFVGGMPGGRQRQANLRALYDRARGYELTSFRGLFRFLRMIERMEERGEDLGAARALGEQEDVVRITTIHKSKGLEFPIVILGALDKQFNQQDLRQRYLLHKDLGFGSKFVDPKNRIMYPTLIYHALKQQMQRDMWAEEMRVLYVALTRAKEKLVMIGTVASLEKKQARWQEIITHPEWVLPAQFRLETNTYLDWIGASLIRHQQGEVLRADQSDHVIPAEIQADPSSWRIQLEHASSYQTTEQDTKVETLDISDKISKWQVIDGTDDALDQLVDHRLTFSYPHQQAARSRAKQTVTELKRQQEQKDAYSDTKLIESFQKPIVMRPNFMQKEKKLTASEIGTAMHTVMQHIPLTKQWSAVELDTLLDKLVGDEIITAEQVAYIDKQSIARFFDTEIGQYLLRAEQVEREIPFSLTVPAEDVYLDWNMDEEERVFIQGVIDLLVLVDGDWLLIDYKTDRLPKTIDQAQIDKLRERYLVQINLYAKALEKIWKQPIKAKYLYFFDQSLLIKVD